MNLERSQDGEFSCLLLNLSGRESVNTLISSLECVEESTLSLPSLSSALRFRSSLPRFFNLESMERGFVREYFGPGVERITTAALSRVV